MLLRGRFIMEVVCILKLDNGKTYGARLRNNGEVRDFTTSELKELYNRDTKLTNAVIDSNGFVRGSRGSNLSSIIINHRPNTVQQLDIRNASTLLNNDSVVIYHGTKNANLKPVYGGGKADTDYGKGFYTTPDIELGKEWAWSQYTKGSSAYLYTYKLKVNNLRVLNLTKEHVVHWIAFLCRNRIINIEDLSGSHVQERAQEISQKYKFNIHDVDIIIGYRADDSFFNYITDFLSGALFLEEVDSVMRYGDLGLQVVLKSRKSFSNLSFISKETVDKGYEYLWKKRNKDANDRYYSVAKNRKAGRGRGTTIFDVLDKW